MNTVKKRNNGLDILRCIAAFLVVSIHAPFPGAFGEYVITIARIAVPLFFIISGYYRQYIIMNNRENQQIIKVLFLLVFANVLYFVFGVIYTYGKGENMSSFVSEIITPKVAMIFVLLNESPFSPHLWYLGGLLNTLLVIKLFKKKVRIFYYLVPILLICDLILGKYSLLIWGKDFPNIVSRNFLFVGIPYYCIGDIFHKINISSRVGKYRKILIALCVMFTITSLAEHWVLVYLDLNATRDHYISTTFLAICVFLLFISSYDDVHNKVERVMVRLGKNYSSTIYIVHPMIVIIYWTVFGKLGIYGAYRYVQPFVVFFSSALVAKVWKSFLCTLNSSRD